MIDDLKKLLRMASSFEADKGPKDLYLMVEDFLKTSYLLDELFVYSVYNALDKSSNYQTEKPRYMRTLWNRKEAQLFIENKKNHDLIVQYLTGEKLLKGKKNYLYLPMGVMDDQFIFAFAPLKKELPSEVSQYLQKYIAHSFTMIRKWQELGKLESLVYVDDVTGLLNQRKLIKDIKVAVENYNTREEGFVVLFIDVDHFKSVNDGHGHLVGTQVLADVATILKGLMRDTDLCYRYGGDEFVMIVPDASSDNGKMIGERILKTIKKHVFKVDKSLLTKEQQNTYKEKTLEFRISVSIGVASFPEDAQNEREVLAIADKMMYQAKQAGRGQVCFASEIFSEDLKEG